MTTYSDPMRRVRQLVIPISVEKWGVLSIITPLSEEEWTQLINVLYIMKPGIVEPNGAEVDAQAGTE